MGNAGKRERDRVRARERRAAAGAQSRSEYLNNSLVAREPWKAQGISRRTWERRGRPLPPDAGPSPPSYALASEPDLFAAATPSPIVLQAKKPDAGPSPIKVPRLPQVRRSSKIELEDDWPIDYQERFWRAYPRRVSKKAAMKALDKVRASGVAWGKLFPAVGRYARWLEDREHWRPDAKHPATWLNGGCWDDELPRGRRLQESKNGWVEAYRAMTGDDDDEDARGYDDDGSLPADGHVLDLDADEVAADGAEGLLAARPLGD